jgi:hypothetical protein
LRGNQGFCGDPAGGRSLGGVVLLWARQIFKRPAPKKQKQDTLTTVKQELHRITLQNDLYRGEG